MMTVSRPTTEEFNASADEYIKMIDNMDEEEIKQILIRTGVLDANGKPKDQIVTGDFFGW